MLFFNLISLHIYLFKSDCIDINISKSTELFNMDDEHDNKKYKQYLNHK